jgi:acyl-CoA thioester hydrolase
MSEPAQPPRKLLNVLRIQVRWADLDANGHVNNATYFTYMEQARIDWLARMDLQMTAQGEGPVVVQTDCNYRVAIAQVDALDVRFYAGPPGRTSFPTYYEIVGVDGAKTLYPDGHAVMVLTNRTAGEKRPVPDRLRELLA